MNNASTDKEAVVDSEKQADTPTKKTMKKEKEFGGREGPEPTRYGDWENKGIISDF